MSRRSGRTVQVRGYWRANGTYVSGYTRSVPSSSRSVSSRCSSASGSSDRTVQVSGYTRSDGTEVSGYTRSLPCSVSYSSESTVQRCYVDNAYNRKVGRVGKPLGTHVIHSGQSASASKVTTPSYVDSAPSECQPSVQRCYVDNAFNRSVGRVGKPLGTHVIHSGQSASASRVTTSSYDDSPPSECQPSVQRCYVDNAYNRKLGRVGKPLGTHVIHSGKSISASKVTRPEKRCYADSAHNQCLGRVGKSIPQRWARQQEIVEESTHRDLTQILQRLKFAEPSRRDYQSALNRLEREQVEESWKKDGVNLSTQCPPIRHVSSGIIPYDELHIEGEIGHGGFGEVHACLWHSMPVAFKKLFYQHMSKKRRENFIREITILAALDHPNTVKMFGVVVEEGKIGIVMEYLLRSLFQAIFIDCVEFLDAKKKEIVHQMANALLYLHTHERKIAHCDVKSENVLLDKNDIAKLGDFGLSVIKNAAESSQSSVAGAPPGQGTPRYSAPEVLRGELLTMSQLLQADVYSLGIVAFEVVAEEEPFEGLSIRQLEANVGHGNLRPTSAVSLSQPLSDLLSSCWDGSASKRPAAPEFIAKWNNISDFYTK